MKFIEIRNGVFLNPERIVAILCYNPTNGKANKGQISVRLDNDLVFNVYEDETMTLDEARDRMNELLEQIKEV